MYHYVIIINKKGKRYRDEQNKVVKYYDFLKAFKFALSLNLDYTKVLKIDKNG
jgi:hypothetical protein